MCRIAGIIDKHTSSSELYQQVKAMGDQLAHGGPDDDGIYLNEAEHLAFAHRRLSIIDLSDSGHQPMTDTQQKAWIVFNGEIYNFQELKRQLLDLGYLFHSSSDTEVILNAYLHWGTKAFDLLKGMFAFALYDVKQNLTYLVRDRSGIKPLYYYHHNGSFYFASEVKAFKRTGLKIEDEPGWKIRLLAYGHIPEPYTILKKVWSLAKGSYLCWNHHQDSFAIHAFAQQTKLPLISSAVEAREKIREYFSAAVKSHLIADAPIGVFLSGGIDSSLITLLAAKQKGADLNSLSIYFEEEEFNERKYQQTINQLIPGKKFQQLIQKADFELAFPQILRAMDQPTNDGINTWFISKAARENGLKSVLSGIGGDELFGGYPSFRRMNYLKKLKFIPNWLKRSTEFIPVDRFKRMAILQHQNIAAEYLFLRGLFTPLAIAKLQDMNSDEVKHILFDHSFLPQEIGLEDEERASWFETNLYMQNQLLRDTDFMSMSHGLEVRLPFLDDDFLQIVHAIDPSIRFASNPPKKLLIDSFKNTLPESVWNRPKMGFSFPLQGWMRDNAILTNEDLYEGKLGKATIRQFKNNQLHWSKAFALFQTQQHA